MIVSELYDDIGLRIHDVAHAEVSTAQLISFINMAVRDARNAGWLLDAEEDETLVEGATTYSHIIPAGFAYISQIYGENTGTGTFDIPIPRGHWRLGLDGSNPVIVMFEPWYASSPGGNIKVVGQKRPTLYTLATDTVDPFLEPYLLEKSTYRAGIFAAYGESEYGATRRDAALLALQESERILSRSPQVFRMKPNSIHVPGR